MCQKTAHDVILKLVSYIIHLRRSQSTYKFFNTSMFAMDETACWMDMPSDSTIDIRGARSVPLSTTGHEKDHFMVILSACADGKKCKPFEESGLGLSKSYKQYLVWLIGLVLMAGQINDSQTADYLHSIIGSLSFSKGLLVWNTYKVFSEPSL